MRRRRPQYTVSTFPFLAVLLCAMGSLILLLFIMDRRAKAVARAKAMEQYQQSIEDRDRLLEEQREELERRRRELQVRLAREQETLSEQLNALRGRLEQSEEEHKEARARIDQAKQRIATEREHLQGVQHGMTEEQKRLQQESAQSDATRREIARLAQELAELERSIQDLLEIRKRRQQTYSLIPYRGRSGDNRRPIYVECSGDRLIFHPDRREIHGATGSRSDIRDEVRSRVDKLRQEGMPRDEKPYLLMLIRPSGVMTYYAVQASLDNGSVDFGYEFIDQDWALDFSDANREALPQSAPLARSDPPEDRSATGVVAPKRGFNFGGGNGNNEDQPFGSLTSSHGNGQPPGQGIAGTGVSEQGGTGTGQMGQDGPSGLASISPPNGNGNGNGYGNGNQTPGSAAGSPRFGTEKGLPAGSASPGQGQSGFGTTTNNGEPGPGGHSDPHAQAQGSGASSSQGTGEKGTFTVNSGPGGMGAPAEGSNANATQGPSAQKPSGDGKPGTPTANQPGQPTTRNDVPGQQPADEMPRDPEENKRPRRGGSPSERDPMDAVGQLATPSPFPPDKRPLPPRPSQVFGNRDYAIVLECSGDSVIIQNTGQAIERSAIARGSARANDLAAAVSQMIERRQAGLRPGEVPYRPVIRFKVRPDGLRTYYTAFPALEALRLPTTREDLDAIDQKPK